MSYASLEELRADRHAYVEIARRNKFEDGLRNLLAELYPDNAHFIYELLQNAEDARAKEVFFDLGKSRLIFTHDGERAFTLDDIEAITGIAQSPKKDDETQIGKFGVGFKAVYAYTNHPEIRSGKYAFRIDDLFVPELVSTNSSEDKTVFTFPFDRKEKRREVAYEEVSRGLRELGATTVLFLSSIRSIRYKLGDGESGRITRADDTAPYISIRHISDGETDETHWLKLVGDHTLSSKIPRGQTVAAAFKLDGPLNRRIRAKGAARAHVVPMDSGQTCIYFPAAKEVSGLRFHIHAPFASTVARDSVRRSEENDELVGAIGQLVARELPALRDDGLIDDGLLASLPSAADPLAPPYTLILDHVREAFWNEAVTPVYADAAFSGVSFAPAKSLVASPTEFRAGIEAKDLPPLLGLAGIEVEGAPRWIAPREGRAGQLLSRLGVARFGWDELESVLDSARGQDTFVYEPPTVGYVHTDPSPEWDRWLMSKDDPRLRLFYELLGRGIFEGDLPTSSVAGIGIVRVRTATRRLHLVGEDVFYPASREELGDGSRVPIALAHFEDDEGKSGAYLEAFYKAAGVRHWNVRSQVQVRLDAYEGKNAESITDAQHLDDIRLFIAHLAEHPEDKGLFKGRNFIQAKPRGSDQEEWIQPDQVAIDKPYLPTGLSLISDYTLSTIYRSRRVEDVAEFAAAVGCVTEISVSKANSWENPQYQRSWNPHGKRWTGQGTKRDFDIPELPKILESKNRDLLRLLWELVVHLQPFYENAVFQLNASEPLRYMKSQLFHHLVDTTWILDKRGRLKKPRAMSIDLLPEGWTEPSPTSFVMRLGFGEEARVKDAQEEAERDLLRKMGAPADLLDEILEAPREEREQLFRDFAERQRRKHAFPAAASIDAERRAAMAGLDAETAPEFETELRERKVVKGSSETKALAREYLKEQYTTDAGLMFCQGCHDPLPFKVRDSWYFEAVQFLLERQRQHHQNYLALCPLCAAKYAYVRDTEDADLLGALQELAVTAEDGTVVIPVSLNGARVELKFTGKHAIDLKAVLAAAGKARG